MPTNDERREVAARLRNYENLRESFRESPICAFIDALGVGYIDWKGVCNRLADLIEPEPERTCRNVADNYYGMGFVCSECTRAVPEDEYDPEIDRYCSCCGAKVVDE